ncbi:MAG: phosphotyrosine protein phosphatase [Rhodomicrobiaceae bacterium]
MMRALFISGRSRARGPTAAQIVAQWKNVRADCAGIASDADDQLSLEQLDWADIIFVMEPRQKTVVTSKFPDSLRGKRMINLDVGDLYSFMEPELVEILTRKLKPHFT